MGTLFENLSLCLKNRYEDWATKEVRVSHGIALWESVRKEWLHISTHMTYRLGNGSRVQFQKDP